MQFGDPFWAYATIPALALLVGLFFLGRQRRLRMLQAFAAARLLPDLVSSSSSGRSLAKAILASSAVAALTLALARPQYGHTWEEVRGQGLDIVVALDTSRSMLAQDVSPNRLERAKLAVLDLLDRLQGDRIGLVAFAGSAFLQCPPTLDYAAFQQSLIALDTETIPIPGTNLAAAISEAEAAFSRDHQHRLIILITDGEDLEAQGVARARQAAARGVRIFTVGIGRPEGSVIQFRRPDGGTDYVRHADGTPVLTRLDESTLQEIARLCQGIYLRLGGPTGLERIYDEALAALPREEREARVNRIPIERYYWPAGAAFVLLAIEFLVGTRKRRLPAAATLVATFVALSAFFPPGALASQDAAPPEPARDSVDTRHASWSETSLSPGKEEPAKPSAGRWRAHRMRQQGRFEEAAEAYRQLRAAQTEEDPTLAYNHGEALYQAGRFPEAAQAFLDALSNPDPMRQRDALYNAALARYAEAMQTRASNPAAAHRLWRDALQSLRHALALDPADEEAWARLQDLLSEYRLHSGYLHLIPSPPAGGTAESSGRYLNGYPIPVKATPHPGWRFAGWEGGGVDTPEESESSLVLEGDTVVYARFIRTFELKVEVTPAHGGQAGPSGTHDEGALARIRAQPIEGYRFDYWEGSGLTDSFVPQTAVRMDRDRSVRAVFAREVNLVARSEPFGAGTVTGTGDFPPGAVVPVTASPAEGYLFSGWEGEGVRDPTAAETLVDVLGPEQDVVARFVRDPSSEKEDSDSSESNDSSPAEDSEPSGGQDQEQQPSESDPKDGDESPPESSEGGEESSAREEPEPAESEPAHESGEPADQKEVPAETMSAEEAEQLLDSLRRHERRLPMTLPPDPSQARPTGRDW